MTKHFSLSIAAEDALENVAKRQRSRFVSDAITAYAKKKDIYTYYNTEKTGATLSNKKIIIASDPADYQSKESSTDVNKNDDICIDKDF